MINDCISSLNKYNLAVCNDSGNNNDNLDCLNDNFNVNAAGLSCNIGNIPSKVIIS